MTIRHNKLTPERLLGAPRRSAALPCLDGTLAVFTKSKYSFDTHSKTSEVAVINIATGEIITITTDVKASDPKWLGDGCELVWLKEGENGNTSFIIGDALAPGKFYCAGTVPGPISNLKLYYIEPGMVAVAVAGQANSDGTLYSPKDVPKTYSSARVYDSLFVRHWDSFITPQRNAIFTAVLKKSAPKVQGRDGRYSLLGFNNALKGTGLECPIPPFGGTDHFDIGNTGLIIVAKDPELDPALHTKCNAYFIPRKDLMDMSLATPEKLDLPGFDGAATSPVFSPDGEKMAFLQMQQDGYESDRNELIIFLDVDMTNSTRRGSRLLFESSNHSGIWDKSPSSVMFSADSKTIFLQAEDEGAGCLFQMAIPPEPSFGVRKLTTSNYIIDVASIGSSGRYLLVSSNSLIDNSIYQLVDTLAPSSQNTTLISSHSRSKFNGESDFGLSPNQVRSIWWKGDNDHPVHALMMVPSFFRPDHKYPLAYLIHGGPQGAWNDQWSTRWNPAVFAEQGYVVICPNPTGSTGYGQGFTDAIQNNWGGSPYIDLVKGFEYIESELDFVDTGRAVALGASYGGYMMNWIQGHHLAKKFKALVCHDGVFSMMAQLASDELYFPVHDLGGPSWERQEVYDKWDPSRFLKNWNTPMLVIHSELDYRLNISEGLAAFNVLQMRGIESRFLSFPDENHWVLKQENSLVWHLVVLNWINGFVGLGKVVDSRGRDGTEYCRRPSRRRAVK